PDGPGAGREDGPCGIDGCERATGSLPAARETAHRGAVGVAHAGDRRAPRASARVARDAHRARAAGARREAPAPPSERAEHLVPAEPAEYIRLVGQVDGRRRLWYSG